MKPRHQASRVALELIERFEGYRRSAAQLDDGRWTIGYGHTRFAREGAEVSHEDAETFLAYDVKVVVDELNDCIYTPLNQNQFDALVAFVFNIGVEGFRRSNVLRRINEGQLLKAACAMEMWRRADFEGERIVIDALVRRRVAEKALFLTPPGGFLPAPSAILRPQLDGEIAAAVPAEEPVEVRTDLDGERAVAERIGPLKAYGPLTPMEPEAAPLAAEAAAEAMFDRLKAIPAEEPSAPVLQAEEPAELLAEPVPEDGFALTPPPVEPEPEPAAHAPAFEASTAEADESAPLFPVEPLAFDDFESQQVAHHEFDHAHDLDEVPLETVRGLSPVAIWLAVMVGGLVVFAGGLFWMLSARGSGGGAHMIFGGGLGLLGITGVATAVYHLLERLGGREEQ
jgi:lysozyme